MTLKTFLLACICLIVFSGFSQTKKDSIANQQPVVVITKDSVIDGKLFTPKKRILPVVESIGIKNLKDLPEASELDEKWLEELYSNSLFDTIYKSVTELEYEPVYYPELSTDTLKARLKRLNARTPFYIRLLVIE